MKGSWSQAIMAVLADWFAVISNNTVHKNMCDFPYLLQLNLFDLRL